MQNRTLYLDRLRVSSILGVIAIHVILGILPSVTPFGVQWWVSQAVCVVLQMCVPVFVMISGALLLDETRTKGSVGHFYSKRFKRIALPGVFWITLYFFFRAHFDGEPVSFLYVVNHLLTVDPPYHTYYLLLIALLYLVTPLLRIYIKMTPNTLRHKHIAVLFSLATLYSMINTIFWHYGRTLLTFFIPYVAYYLSGHELHTLTIKPLKSTRLAVLVGVCVLYLALHVNTYAEYQGRLHGRFVLGMLSLPVILLSLAWFSLVKSFDKPMPKLDWLVKRIAPATFGIYLSHVAILIGLGCILKGKPKESEFAVNVVLGTTMTFLLSYLLTVLLRRLPVLKWVV